MLTNCLDFNTWITLHVVCGVFFQFSVPLVLFSSTSCRRTTGFKNGQLSCKQSLRYVGNEIQEGLFLVNSTNRQTQIEKWEIYSNHNSHFHLSVNDPNTFTLVNAHRYRIVSPLSYCPLLECLPTSSPECPEESGYVRLTLAMNLCTPEPVLITAIQTVRVHPPVFQRPERHRHRTRP